MSDTTGTTPPPTATAIDDQAEAAVRGLLALAHEAQALETAIEPLRHLVDRWRSPVARVAAVGEVSVGKSTLLNALVRTPVLPSAVEALSSVQVELVHGPARLATVFLRRGTTVTVRDVADEQETEDYLTARGAKMVTRRHGRDAEVLGAVIALPSELLAAGLRLTDTPGVGGLNPAHRRATVAALADTDAVLFAIRPDRPISASELRFLAESVGHVGSYVIVQTHADQTSDAAARLRENLATLRSPQTWTALLGDEARGRELADRFREEVTGVSVSAKQVLAAYQEPAGPGRDRELELSGLTELGTRLRTDVIDQIGLIHRRTLLHLADSTMAAVADRLTGRRSLLAAGEEGERAIRARQRNVHRWIAKHGDVWKPDLDAAADEAQKQVRELAEERVRVLRADYEQRFAGQNPKALQEICLQLVTEPAAASAEMQALVKRRLDTAVDEITRDDPQGPVGAHLGRLQSAGELAVRVPGPLTAGAYELDDTTASAAAMVGVGVMSRSVVFEQRKQGTPHPYGTTVALAGAAIAALPAAVLMAGAAAVLFGGIAAWRKRRARTQEAAAELLEDVLSAIRVAAANDACAQACEQRDALTVEIQNRLEQEQAQVDRDRADLVRITGLTLDQRVGLLNEIDLAERELERLRAQFEEARLLWTS
ncbi:dynamin family protein [Streptomyces sp. NPDC004610]|uniref:dynamin family protein n=1 Tax=unclassified Streptomyces TaxID=2593676 RepID=UPI0033AD2A07